MRGEVNGEEVEVCQIASLGSKVDSENGIRRLICIAFWCWNGGDGL